MSVRDKFATVSKDSWHYRLTRYGLDESICRHIKRACPYWVVLVPVSVVFGSIRFIGTVLFETALYAGYYPWMALAWVLGFKPRYWRGLVTKVRQRTETKLLYEERWNEYGEHYDVAVWHWWPPLLMTQVFWIPVVIWEFGFGREQINAAMTALPWYFTAVIAYAGLLALIALGNGWKHGPWPLIYRAYCFLCPELKVVESAPSRSRTEPAR